MIGWDNRVLSTVSVRVRVTSECVKIIYTLYLIHVEISSS